jgi:Flp pilus assembly protein TadD
MVKKAGAHHISSGDRRSFYQGLIRCPALPRKSLLGILAITLLFLAVTVTFSPVLRADFVNYDDLDYITANDRVKGGLSIEGLAWAARTLTFANWHPVTWISHMTDVEIFGLDPRGHHLTSLVLHLLNSNLLLLILWRMTGAFWRSLFTAALFGIHPLHVESVAWLSARKDLLSTLFLLLTILAYHRYTTRGRWGGYLLALLFFSLGLAAKPMLITLPFVLLLLDWWPLGRFERKMKEGADSAPSVGRGILTLLLEKVPFMALSGASIAITIFAQWKSGAVASFEAFPLTLRLKNAVVSYVTYMGMALWPQGLHVHYPFPGSIPLWKWGGSVLLLILATAFVLYRRKKEGYLFTGWFLYVGTLVPVIGLVQVGGQAMADRYTYVPLTGLFLAIIWWAERATRGRSHRRLFLAGMGAVFLALSVTSMVQAGHWRNTFTLFERVLRIDRDNAVAHVNLGYALERQGRMEDAVRHYRQALEAKPLNPEANNNLGNHLKLHGDVRSAIEHYRRGLRGNDRSAKLYNNLGIALIAYGMEEEGLAQLRRAVEVDPDYPDGHYNLGSEYAKREMQGEAEKHLRRALELRPRFTEALVNLGVLSLSEGRIREAEVLFLKALEVNPQFEAARVNLERARAQQPR